MMVRLGGPLEDPGDEEGRQDQSGPLGRRGRLPAHPDHQLGPKNIVTAGEDSARS